MEQEWEAYSFNYPLVYWLSNLVTQYAAMARCLKSFFIYTLAPAPFINHLKISLKVMLKQKSNHFIVQSLS